MKTTYRRATLAVLASSALLVPMAALADWAALRYALDDARSKLEKVAKSDDFDDARDNARRAKNALDDAAMAAGDVNCPSAYSELDDAATKARRARDASDVEELADNYRRAVRAYNDAVAYLKQCARGRH